MLLLRFAGVILCRDLRLVSLFSDNQSIKSTAQIDRYYHEISRYFSFKIKDSVVENWNRDIFMLLDGKEIAAFLQMEYTECYDGSSKRKPYAKYLCIYCVTVTEKYRGMKLSYEIVRRAVKEMTEHYKLPKDTILALHLSSENPEMFIAMQTYYKLGFTKGTFSASGPPDFQYKISKLFENENDVYDIARDPSISKTPGKFVMMYCLLKNFDRVKIPLPADAIERGKSLMEVCAERARKQSAEKQHEASDQ